MTRVWVSAAVAVLLLTVRVGTSSPAPAGTPARLTGVVVAADDSGPIKGATVEVHERLDTAAERERRAAGAFVRDPLVTGTTDQAGRFELRVPPGARVVVAARAPAHAAARFAPLITPIAGAPARDLGRLELDAGRRLEGRVTDPDGKPLSGARVAAAAGTRFRGSPGMRMPRTGQVVFVSTGRTGADGSFTLEGLPQRGVTVRVYADGYAPASLSEPRGGGRVEARLARGHEVSGVVLSPEGAPAAGAWVMAGDDGLDGMTRADGQGRFTLARIAAGTRTLTATGDDILIPKSPADAVPSRASWACSSPLRVVLPAPAGTPEMKLKLRPGATLIARALDAATRAPIEGAILSLDEPGDFAPRTAVVADRGEAIFLGVPAGSSLLRASADGFLDEVDGPRAARAGESVRITAAMTAAASIEGTVRDAAGRPVAGARVALDNSTVISGPVAIPIFTPLGEPSYSDDQGRFHLEQLPANRPLRLRIERDDFIPWEQPDLRLRAGEKRTGVDAALDAGLLITGRLLDPDRQPVAGAVLVPTRAREDSPMGGMVVRVATAGGPRGRSQSFGGGDALHETTTSADGVFRARGARPGVWSLDIKARGFAPKSVAGLKLEESARTLDAGDIVLERGAAVRGRITDTSGQPIPYARGVMRREMASFAEVLAGPDGAFALEDLHSGDAVTITFTAEGYGEVEKGGIVPPMDDLVVALPAASRLSGQVLDQETRRPVEDYTVSVSRGRAAGGGGMMMMSMGMGAEQAVHAEDGAFSVEGVSPGKVAVTVRSPGYKEAALREVEVPEGKDVGGLMLLLDRAVSVSGVVVDDQGRPLPGVEVSKSESHQGFTRMRLPGIGPGGNETDGEGRFVLDGLERGPVTLTFSHPEFEPTEKDVDASRDVEGLRIPLSRGASLTGIVMREDDGSPVASATVMARPAGSRDFGAALTARTGADGAFQIDAMRPGRYTVSASAAGLRAPGEPQEIVIVSGTSPPPLEMRLGGGVTLTGTVTGVKEDELPRMSVNAFVPGASGPAGSAAVDSTGRFEMKGLPAGSVNLRAGSSVLGGRSITRTVQIPSGVATFETTIDFPRGRKVEGTVTRAGQPVDGATVIFSLEGFRSSSSATTDAAGHYLLEDLDEGEYTVNLMHFSSGQSHSTKLTVSADRSFDIEFPTVRLDGTVTDAGSGRPLDGVAVAVDREGARPAGGINFMNQARTDATGAFHIEGLSDGSYTLTARRDGYAAQTRTVQIVPSVDPDPVAFELSRADGLVFRALDARSGMPLNRLEAIALAPLAGDPLAVPPGAPLYRGSLSADAAGLFRLDSLGPGTYTLVLGGEAVATRTLRVTVPSAEASWTMEPGGALEVTAPALTGTETARGVLLDSGGIPVHWQLFSSDPTFTVRSDSPTVLRNLPAGSYRVRLQMPGASPTERNVTITPSTSARLSVP